MDILIHSLHIINVGPPTEEKIERRDPHPEKSEDGTEYVYLCVSHCKFVILYLGMHWVSTTASQHLISHVYHMAQNILELCFVHMLSLSRHWH